MNPFVEFSIRLSYKHKEEKKRDCVAIVFCIQLKGIAGAYRISDSEKRLRLVW